MARGANSKNIATEAILKTFPGSFIYDKEIRIPYIEDGEQIQLKCVLTCAKINVEQGGENMIPGEEQLLNENGIAFASTDTQETIHIEPSQEEKDNVKRLMDVLGL